MDMIETWFFKTQKELDNITKGKRVFRRNLKKDAIGYAKVIDGCLKDSWEKENKALDSKYCYQISNTKIDV
jgi:hypothetical protein